MQAGQSFRIVVGAALLALGCAENPPRVIRVDLSPDGARRAVLYVVTQGGALGSCRQYVIVEPADSAKPTPESLTGRYDDTVFDCSCGEHPSTTWRGAAELEIEYQVDRFGISTTQRSATLDGSVRLRYVPRYE